jgi:hypothetical protein
MPRKPVDAQLEELKAATVAERVKLRPRERAGGSESEGG